MFHPRARLHVEMLLVVLTAGLWVVPADAHAYLDPGTGSLIFQATVGALLSGAVAVRMYWARLRAFFSGSRDKDTPASR